MDESQEKETLRERSEIENARVGYQTAMDIWLYELEIASARFNALLVANSILIAVIGSLIVAFPDPLAANAQVSVDVCVTILCAIGVALCVVWFLLMKRNLDYRWYWMRYASELEEKYLSNPLRMLPQLERFSHGDPVSFDLVDNSKPVRLSRLGRVARTDSTVYLIVLLFLMVYLLLLCLFWLS